jgi:hypothetical protein
MNTAHSIALRTSALAAAAVMAAASSAQNLGQLVVDQIGKGYGRSQQLRFHDSLLYRLRVGDALEGYKSRSLPGFSGGANNYMNADVKLSLASSLRLRASLSAQPSQDEARISGITRTESFGGGSASFDRQHSGSGRFGSVLKSLGIDVSGSRQNELTVKVTWSDLQLDQLDPSGFLELGRQLNGGRRDFFRSFQMEGKGYVWLVRSALTMRSMVVEIQDKNKGQGLNIGLKAVAGSLTIDDSNQHVRIYRLNLSDAQIASRADFLEMKAFRQMAGSRD